MGSERGHFARRAPVHGLDVLVAFSGREQRRPARSVVWHGEAGDGPSAETALGFEERLRRVHVAVVVESQVLRGESSASGQPGRRVRRNVGTQPWMALWGEASGGGSTAHATGSVAGRTGHRSSRAAVDPRKNVTHQPSPDRIDVAIPPPSPPQHGRQAAQGQAISDLRRNPLPLRPLHAAAHHVGRNGRPLAIRISRAAGKLHPSAFETELQPAEERDTDELPP